MIILASSPDLPASFGTQSEAEGLVSQVTGHDVRIERQVERQLACVGTTTYG